MWEASAALDPSFAIVHRNLATAYMHQVSGADLNRAIAELEKAVSLDRKYALHFTELDQLYEQAGVPLEKRMKLFDDNAAVVAQRDDALNRKIALEIALGKVDEAIQTMTDHTFAVAEGANLNVSEHWTDAHILRAQAEIQTKRYDAALADLQTAATVPANLPVGNGAGGVNARAAEIAYWSGVAYKDSGDAPKAAESWKLAVAPPVAGADRRVGQPVAAGGGAQAYYRGLAYEELGEEAKAQELFRGLVQSGQDELKQQPSSVGLLRGRTANAHYLAGLGDLGLKNQVDAKTELQQAVQESPDLLGARTALASLPN